MQLFLTRNVFGKTGLWYQVGGSSLVINYVIINNLLYHKNVQMYTNVHVFEPADATGSK